MLIWLNGPFGIGKTSAAEALIRRLPGAIVFDPEPVGLMLCEMYRSVEPVEDFQDLQAWHAAVPALVRVLHPSHAAPVVMPMTVWRRDYFTEIMTALRAADDDVRCFCLTACEQVLRARILGRDPLEATHEWSLRHLPTGLRMMQDPLFGEQVATCERSPDQVVGIVAATAESF
ncbi:MAG: AAA family ATPase [Chloroflexi bacterium]|nr:AAA family ATPase [Chloroflexota bacterium]